MNPAGYNITEGDKAAPARKRFTDPAAVYACYDELKDQDDRDSKRRAKIRIAYDGGLPYSIDQLKAKGLAHMTNLSSNSLRGTIESRSDPTVSLVNAHFSSILVTAILYHTCFFSSLI